MSAEFAFPAWAAGAAADPPPTPPVDPHRIGDLVNGFIAAKQDALFDSPDAFYRQTGADAVAAAPAVATRLAGLRDAALEDVDDHERPALSAQLDAQLGDALDGIDRHATKQREVHNRAIITQRRTLIERAAALDHNDEGKLVGLAAANAGAAQELAQLDGVPDEPAMRAARSAVWRNAIAERLAIGQAAPALSLFQRVNNELVPADQRALEVPLQVARTNAATDAWIAREAAKVGDPLSVRVQADAGLSPAEKAATLAKIEERDSAKESVRIATVRGLDDKLDATADALATNPGTYRPGTLAALANAYDDAREPGKAAPIRRLAQQESFLLSFARSNAAAQQRLIDGLPEGDERAAAEAIRDRQAEAFARDPFGAGTALYLDAGPPKPIDDVEGRVEQARLISAYRGIAVVPFTAAELAKLRQQYATGTAQERSTVLSLVDALPDDMKPPLDGPSPSGPHTFGIDAVASMRALRDLPAEGANENAADAGTRGAAPATRELTTPDRMINQWMNQARPGDEVPPELAERLGVDEKRAIEAMPSQVDSATTDPSVLREILTGLKSRNPEEARKWARAPLYKERTRLSREDFARVVELQQDLDVDGISRSEIAAIRKQLKASDTSDLTPLYRALAPAGDAKYGTYLPVARDANGLRPAMPEKARAFLKGVLDLLAGTRTGELTPDAIDAFTAINGGAGRLIGPRGGAETLAAGGKLTSKLEKTSVDELEKDIIQGSSELRKLTHVEQSAANFAKGRAWQEERAAYYRAKGYEVAEQVTVLLPSGRKIRLDLVFRHPETKDVIIIELKASEHPRIRRPQREKYEELKKFGGTVVGQGKGEFPGGTKIGPTGFTLETPYNTKQP